MEKYADFEWEATQIGQRMRPALWEEVIASTFDC